MGSPGAGEEGGEEVGGGRWESGERREVQARSTLTSTAPKARPGSGEVATLDEVPQAKKTVTLWYSTGIPGIPQRSFLCGNSTMTTWDLRAWQMPRAPPRWAVFCLVVSAFLTHRSAAQEQDICELVRNPDFNAYWVGEVIANSIMGHFKQLDSAQHRWTMEGVTPECITNPVLFIVVSTIWRPSDEEGGRRVANRMVATSRRLTSEQKTAGTLAVIGSRILMHDLGNPCMGLKIVRQALSIDPTYLPAFALVRILFCISCSENK